MRVFCAFSLLFLKFIGAEPNHGQNYPDITDATADKQYVINIHAAQFLDCVNKMEDIPKTEERQRASWNKRKG